MNASDSTLPDSRVTSLLIDERERTVTVYALHPTEPTPEGHNASEEIAVHTSVDALTVTGWSHEPVTAWESTPLPDDAGRIAVALSGPATSVTFHADAAVRRTRRPLRTGAL
ncbi:hypothetical protein [Streptomyces sp. NPDC049881]|uniref:hypothetical protein n=1 Tax=Streptomyces sp. NPDC049881 TaxID=3155778 RepID=UPI003429B60E